MFRKLISIATVAVIAVATLATNAQANKPLQPLHEGAPFIGTVNMPLSGPLKLQGELGGFEAYFDLAMTLHGGDSTGAVTSLTLTNPKPFGLIGHCTFNSMQTVGLPWTVHAEETTDAGPTKTLDVTSPQFRISLSGFLCPSELNITGGTVVARPNNAGAISSLSLSGTLNSTAGFMAVSGSLTPGAGYLATYGLG